MGGGRQEEPEKRGPGLASELDEKMRLVTRRSEAASEQLHLAIERRVVIRKSTRLIGITLKAQPSRDPSDVVVVPPGDRLAATLSFLLTRKAFKRYVEPVIADMQEEYVDASTAGHVWHARWIAVRGHLLVIPGWLYAFLAGRLLDLLRG